MMRPSREDDERFTVVIPSELNRELGFAAVQFKLNKRDIVEAAVREFLSNHDDGGELYQRMARDQRARLGRPVATEK